MQMTGSEPICVLGIIFYIFIFFNSLGMIPNSTGSNFRQPKKPNNPPNSTVRRGRRFGGRQRNAAGSFSFHLQEMAKNNETRCIF
ncbi:conserved hypothetical protein [Trichinella spiralis]|uniref:hypothetical protein n=1 Tax=Trichinella spiralis TaxID=6334 RepID=UPI0001EFC485|nr:conserved hypothetical protein [Trichinella spiralis]